jgi:hypothetical protein
MSVSRVHAMMIRFSVKIHAVPAILAHLPYLITMEDALVLLASSVHNAHLQLAGMVYVE